MSGGPVADHRDSATGTLHLTLVRHGTTAWNEGGRWQGLTDNPLGPQGEAQARALRERLAGQTFDAVWSSDLQRAVQTAELALPGQPLRLDPRLREYHFGDFEGFTVPQMQAHAGFVHWQADPWPHPAPGGESLRDVARRMRAWADELPDGRVIAFSHSVAIRTLLVDLFATPLETQENYPIPYRERLKNGQLVTLRREKGEWTREAMGDS